MILCAIAVWGALAIAAPAALAAHLSALAPRTIAFSSDGARYVAWQVSDGAPITVLDTASGHRGAIAAPSGCGLVGEEEGGGEGAPAAAGRFLLTCAGEGPRPEQSLLDARTGAVARLPGAAGIVRWSQLGARYVEGTASSDRCTHTQREVQHEALCVALYAFASGQVSYRSASVPADLSLLGAPPVCRALRGELAHSREAGLGSSYGYAGGAFARGARRGAVRVDRCHGRSRTIAGARGSEPVNLDPRGGLLTWDTGHEASDSELSPAAVSRGELFSSDLSGACRRSWRLPLLSLSGANFSRGVFGYSAHTAHMVFWIAARTVVGALGPGTVGSSSVYAARL